MIEIKHRGTGAVLRTIDAKTLHGATLREANLAGADLRWDDLGGADLSGADLRGADLRGADLCDADLSWADLRGADLRRADLRGADMPEGWQALIAEMPPDVTPAETHGTGNDESSAADVVLTALLAANRYRRWEATTHETLLCNGDLNEPSQAQAAMEWYQARADDAEVLLDSWPDYPDEVMRLAALATMPDRGPGNDAHSAGRDLDALLAAALAYVTGATQTEDDDG